MQAQPQPLWPDTDAARDNAFTVDGVFYPHGDDAARHRQLRDDRHAAHAGRIARRVLAPTGVGRDERLAALFTLAALGLAATKDAVAASRPAPLRTERAEAAIRYVSRAVDGVDPAASARLHDDIRLAVYRALEDGERGAALAQATAGEQGRAA